MPAASLLEDGFDLDRVVPSPTSRLLAGRLRSRHYHRTTCAVSMVDCVLAAAAVITGESVATSDPHLLNLCHSEGIAAIPLPGSDG